MGSLRTLCATLTLLATTLAFAPNAAASGCWYEDAFVTDQELVAYGDAAVYLVIQQAGYSETCDPSDAQPYTSRCLGVGTDQDEYTTPPVVVQELRVLGQTIVPEQEVVPAQTIPVPADPILTLVEDPVCTTFVGDFDQFVVSLRVENEGEETTLHSNDPTEFVYDILKDNVIPRCYTPEASGKFICYSEEYIQTPIMPIPYL